jgi:hypothetical protein
MYLGYAKSQNQFLLANTLRSNPLLSQAYHRGSKQYMFCSQEIFDEFFDFPLLSIVACPLSYL